MFRNWEPAIGSRLWRADGVEATAFEGDRLGLVAVGLPARTRAVRSAAGRGSRASRAREHAAATAGVLAAAPGPGRELCQGRRRGCLSSGGPAGRAKRRDGGEPRSRPGGRSG